MLFFGRQADVLDLFRSFWTVLRRRSDTGRWVHCVPFPRLPAGRESALQKKNCHKIAFSWKRPII